MKTTATDRKAFAAFCQALQCVQDLIVRRGGKPSAMQPELAILAVAKFAEINLTSHRIDRLIAAGYIQTERDDGQGRLVGRAQQ